MLSINAVEQIAAQFGNLSISNKIEQNVKGKWSKIFGEVSFQGVTVNMVVL